MSAQADLELAGRILSGSIRLGIRGPRVAAVITQSVFESWVDWMSSGWSLPDARPTTRSLLIVLQTLNAAEVGNAAQRIWEGLSRACHLHAYELTPSAAEIRILHTETTSLLTTPLGRATGHGAPLSIQSFLPGTC